MSNVKSQVKWVVKHFSNILLVLFVATAAIAYFTTRISFSTFSTIALVVVAVEIALMYYGLATVKSGLTFALLALLLVVGVKYSKRPDVNPSQFQVVYLTNGTSYFGHLKNVDTTTPTLTDVYFLRSAPQQQSGTNTTTPAAQPVLQKLSSDIHSPDDSMVIKSDQIVFWENLQSNGKVAQAITKDLEKK